MSIFETERFEGKPFHLGVQDCFTLVRDFYLFNFGIEMPDISRPNDWDASKDDIIGKSYEACGFEKLDVDETWPPLPADILACVVGGSTPNHLVVYMGHNEILHHKYGVMSSRETMRPAWKRYTSYILRHPLVPNLSPVKPTMTLKEAYDEGLA